LDNLKDSCIKERYLLEVENKFTTPAAMEEETTPAELWLTMKDTLKETANVVLGKQRKRTNKPYRGYAKADGHKESQSMQIMFR
jgi:hypothetical protein